MKGYYFHKETYLTNVLYVPQNIVIFEDEGIIEVDNSSQKIKFFDEHWNRKSIILKIGLEKQLISEVDVSDELLSELRANSFSGDEQSVRTIAARIFNEVECKLKGD